MTLPHSVYPSELTFILLVLLRALNVRRSLVVRPLLTDFVRDRSRRRRGARSWRRARLQRARPLATALIGTLATALVGTLTTALVRALATTLTGTLASTLIGTLASSI